MPVNKLLAKIHIAKKELGLEDGIYRDILWRKFKVTTSKALANSQAMVLIHHFEALGWNPKPGTRNPELKTKYDDQKGDIYSATPAQKRKIEAMWHDIYRGNDETKHLRQFLWNHFKVSDIRFLNKDKAYDVIEGLKAMKQRRVA